MFELFENREQAGRALAAALAHHRNDPDLLVMGLARGGMPVAAPIARELGAELDVLIIRKIRAPGHPELAIGAVGPDRVRVLNDDIIAHLGISATALVHATHKAREELAEREQRYRLHRPASPVKGRTVLIVDDGLATGASLEAAIAWAREAKAGKVIAATPVAAAEAHQRLEKKVEEFVTLKTPWDFQAVSRWYRVFDQTSDDEVAALLEQLGPLATDKPGNDVGHRNCH
ncbi:phosphoribosyltransferase family protein [Gammaproteobacteria bacterium AB-CW1]|uniref:Phosphoribosyltransferase family protein n=1 Tax=Natronospira elongata TaxID=3110268 RepID=A0AAP6MMR2_9GAMM|nr:phosphoribosyltransferase family protein [Gammaproteobacteria bacterium AB-CW1]